jgi:diadenosine tetraphosphate (Ap4A) HIT family hydrolase/carbonic anhydrase/acetyltransferase-like protein (isoleucine patch superfamily)
MEDINTDTVSCPFCNKSIDQRTLKESAYSRLIIPRHGIDKTQLLITSKRHVSSINQLYDNELLDIFQLIKYGLNVLKRNNIENYNIAINKGQIAGQTVTHFHIHLIPRTKGDIKEPKKWLNVDLFKKLEEYSNSDILQIKKDLSLIDIDCPKYSLGENCLIETNVNIANDNRTELKTSIGSNSIIRSGSVIYSGVKIGDGFDCGHNVVIRERCTIGSNVYIYPNTIINTDVVIGDNCTISGYICNRGKIGNNVNMFGKLIHKFKTHNRGVIEKSPIIEDNCTIGWDSLIIGDVRIKKDSFIKAKDIVK